MHGTALLLSLVAVLENDAMLLCHPSMNEGDGPRPCASRQAPQRKQKYFYARSLPWALPLRCLILALHHHPGRLRLTLTTFTRGFRQHKSLTRVLPLPVPVQV